MKVAIDTNILVYALGFDDLAKQIRCLGILRDLREMELAGKAEVCVPVQVLMELYGVLRYKKRLSPPECEARITPMYQVFTRLDTNFVDFQDAMHLAHNHHLQIFDAVILSICARFQCRILLSEDMHGGFRWRSCQLINPMGIENSERTIQDIVNEL
jgi:predicted nucleic acid-binding protein